jgi:hypothetical protein
MKAKKGQGINELMVIKLFRGNYARDLWSLNVAKIFSK